MGMKERGREQKKTKKKNSQFMWKCIYCRQERKVLLYASKGSTFSDGSCQAQIVESRLPLKHMSPVLDIAMLRTPCLVERREGGEHW